MRTTRPPPPPPAPAGRTPFGGYQLQSRIAVGGMAEVFRAEEPRSAGAPRTVVVKRLLPSLASEAGARAMLAEEARLGAYVHHPNVVEIFGFGEEQGQPFLVMEYVPGLDLWRLTRWLTRTGKVLGVPVSMYLMGKLLEGLEAIHDATNEAGEPLGIVHRDVSPSNVLISTYGDVKLADMGIARAQMRETFPQAPVGEQAKGKLGYLAPEQVGGGDCDRRADVFSAAVIAAELLMGRPLFAGGSELAVLLAIRDGKIHPLLEILPTLPSGLGEALIAALAPAPVDRTASAGALRATLMGYVDRDAPSLARELAELVSQAIEASEVADVAIVSSIHPDGYATPLGMVSMDSRTPSVEDVERRTPIATVYDDQAARTASLAPLPGPTAEFPALDPEGFDSHTVTGDIEAFEVRTGGGDVLGPWSYSRVIEAVNTGKVGPSDKVRRGLGSFRPVAEVTEIARHLPRLSMAPRPRQDAPAQPNETGLLRDGGFVTTLGRSILRKDTGLILCEQGGVRKEVYLDHGAPEFVASNLAGEMLGEYLVARSIITRGELDMALAVMPRFEGKLGDTLAALGLVEPVHLFRHIAEQVREKLLDLFLWSAGTVSLYLGVPPPASGFPLGIDPWTIMEEGVRRRVVGGHEDDLFDALRSQRLVRVEANAKKLEAEPIPDDARLLLREIGQLGTIAKAETRLRDPHDPLRAKVGLGLLIRLGAVEGA